MSRLIWLLGHWARISDPISHAAQLVALSHLRGTVPFGAARENVFVQLYEEAAGETLELDLFRPFWVFQLGGAYHGWKSFGIESSFNCKQIEELLPLALADCRRHTEPTPVRTSV
jgi:hypothetical protein